MEIKNQTGKKFMKYSTQIILGLTSLWLCSAGGWAQVVSYNFNQGTGLATNSGSAGSAGDLTINAPAAWSANGGGVSGQPGDYAYVGTNASGSYAATSGSLTALNSLTAFTITGWVSTAHWAGDAANGPAIVSYNAGFGQGFGQIREIQSAAGVGELMFKTSSFGSIISSTGGQYDDSPLDFFAVTWDGTTGLTQFYLGTTAATASLVSTIGGGPMGTAGGANSGSLFIGDVSAGGAFYQTQNGSIDDIRIYNTVLNGSTIEGIRTSALAAVPEPSAISLWGIGLLLLILVGRRRQSPQL
jgi:hypothetical protein